MKPAIGKDTITFSVVVLLIISLTIFPLLCN
jgi:hypothetical protein